MRNPTEMLTYKYNSTKTTTPTNASTKNHANATNDRVNATNKIQERPAMQN
jgi:hypothetical protein